MQTLTYTLDRDVGVLTLNRAEKHNALNKLMLEELSSFIIELETQKTPKALIITGSGEKAFCAGADLNQLQSLQPHETGGISIFAQQTFSRLLHLSCPVIAAVNGIAFGGGFELALSCDFIYAAKEAVFALPEVSLGLIPGWGGTQRLSRAIGVQKARELIFTSKPITAKKALELNLISKVSHHVLEDALTTAKIIAQSSPKAMQYAKSSINHGVELPIDEAFAYEAKQFVKCFTDGDGYEGISAFLEKRKANFQTNVK